MQDSTREEEIKTYFESLGIPLSSSWFSSIRTHLSSTQTSITKETCTRLFLASDITHSLASFASSFPDSDAPRTGASVVCVQVVSTLEIGSSLSSLQNQLEEYKERQKPINRRLVSLQDSEEPDVDSTLPATTTTSSEKDELVSKKMVKVVLQDAKGSTMYGIDVVSIPELRMGMTLGSKLLLEDVSIVHNVMILKPDKVQWLGGHVQALNSTLPTSLARLYQDLETRLRQFPVMTVRDRQRAVADQARQEEQDGAGFDGYNQDNAGNPVQNNTRGRGGRGRGMNGRSRARARGGRARGR